MARAWIAGFMILFIADMLWIVGLQFEVLSKTLLLAGQVSPFIAAFASSYLAPRRKILLGCSMSVPAAILGVALTAVYQLFGAAGGFRGIQGAWILFEITIVYSAILCIAGSGAGYFLSRKRKSVNDHKQHVTKT